MKSTAYYHLSLNMTYLHEKTHVEKICNSMNKNMTNLHSPAFLHQNKNILLYCWNINKKVSHLVLYFPTVIMNNHYMASVL